MDTMETNDTEIEGVLCSTKFDNIIHIALKEFNNIPVGSNYQETSVKNAKRIYFKYARSTQKKTMNKHNETIKH